jgi:thiosulfate/3-mercaptopyruvate sulfurtransferase
MSAAHTVQRLLEPRQLLAQLNDPKVVVVHVASEASYEHGHVPGAVHVAPAELVSGTRPATGSLPDVARLETLFARLGYDSELHFVAYDDEGGGWAGRFLWTLDVIGQRAWSYLNGGLAAWTSDSLPLESTPRKRAPRDVRVSLSDGPQARAEEILRRLDDSTLLVWDCRSREEFVGVRSGSTRSGHIPGAVHLDWLDLMDRDRALRLRTDLGVLLARHGIDGGRDVVTHCQTHHRSGLAYLVGRLLEFPRIRAYAGSWSEWGNRADTPIATGD